MPSLVIRNLPPHLHQRLKVAAAANHRSMTQQAIVLLEQGLSGVSPLPPFKAHRGRFPVTDTFIRQARKEGRA